MDREKVLRDYENLLRKLAHGTKVNNFTYDDIMQELYMVGRVRTQSILCEQDTQKKHRKTSCHFFYGLSIINVRHQKRIGA
jgi:hypothetical protein